MTDRTVRWLGAALAIVLAGCSTTAPAVSDPAPSSQASTAETVSTEDRSALESLYWERLADARDDYTQANVDFMVGMIGHHAQALVMSAYAEPNGASPAIQTLAARIVNAQKDEIATMQRWLRLRGEPVPEVHIEGTTLMIHMPEGDMAGHDTEDHEGMDHSQHGGMDHGGMDHGGMNHGEMDQAGMHHGGMDHSLMPGMLTQAQLDELAAAQGATFDRLYLTYMIQHHQGAVVMVEDLVGTDGAMQDEDSFRLASDIQVDQKTEIARMQQMLDALPSE